MSNAAAPAVTPGVDDPDDLTPDERALLEGKQPAASGGDDDAGTDPKAAAPADGEQSGADADAEALEAAERAAAEAAAASAASQAPTEPEVPEVEPMQYQLGEQRDFKAERSTLRGEERTAFKQLMDGEIDAEAYAAVKDRVQDSLDAITRDETRAATLAEANRQQAEAAQVQTLQRIAKIGKTQGIDYGNRGVSAMFDATFDEVATSEEFKGKSYTQVALEAHNRIVKLFGKTPATAPAPAAAAAAAPAEARPAVPQTLRNMPAAAAAPVGNDLLQQIGSINDPDAAEETLAALPMSQRQALMRSTVRTH